MKRLLLFLLVSISAFAQDPNPQGSYATSLLFQNPSLYLNFNEPTATFHDQITNDVFTNSSNLTALQPGMTLNNFSAGVPYNGWNAAPNNTLGSIEWDVPWSMVHHIDRLEWNRAGQLILESKGDLAAGTYWKLFLQMNGPAAQICFERHGGAAAQGVCTGTSNLPSMDIPNGYNYDIVVVDSGTGDSGDTNHTTGAPALSLYVNGTGPAVEGQVQMPTYAYSLSFANGFGAVGGTVSGGTGYANSTNVSVSGCGPGGTVSGMIMESIGGVPHDLTVPNGGDNYGCTTVPTYTLVSPTGTGVTITPSLIATTMNDSTNPLMIPGYVSGGTKNGIDQTDPTQTTTFIDEAATFSGKLNQTAIQSLLYQSNFQSLVVDTLPPNRIPFIFDDDGLTDEDNFYALQAAIKAQQSGYIQLEGVIAETSGFSVFRQMLDAAGLAQVPVGILPGAADDTNIGQATYNATTSLHAADYPLAATVYRTVMAANPTTTVNIYLAGELSGAAQLMQSAPDSISSLTGQQLWDQDAANGATVFSQGGFCVPVGTLPCTGQSGQQGPFTDAQYVYAHHGAMPMKSIAGTPQNSGPGPLYTRTSTDPMFLLSTHYGTDLRSGWDSLPMTSFISSYFSGGGIVTVGGSGTGYPDTTNFFSSGGGTNCHMNGTMLSSSGVPTGAITTTWGMTQDTFSGLGYGCPSLPTLTLDAGHLNTSFNEAGAGTPLAGTTPATCTSGCVPPWALASGTDGTYQSGGGVLFSTVNTVPDLIDTGVNNYKIVIHPSVVGGSSVGQLVVRDQSQGNWVVINFDGTAPALEMFNVVAGVGTSIGSPPSIAGSITNDTTVTVNGSTITVSNSNGSMTGTSTYSTGSKIGLKLAVGTSFEVTALSATSLGSGATLTPVLTGVCGTDTFTPPSTEVFTSTGSNCDNVWVLPMSVLAIPGQANIFQWYLNSLISPPANQRPLR